MTNATQLRRPDWIKIRLKTGENFLQTKTLLENQGLNTVCEEARCPNIYECWERKTATVMILGDICTRACRFCSVKTGRPGVVDEDEPLRTAEAIKRMGLTHVVITSVDRDDLKNDYGSRIWALTIRKIHEIVNECTVEVLTPDFKGYKPALDNIFLAGPEIFSHNIECIPRISKKVRSQANWEISKSVLEYSISNNMNTKTGMMVGLGETDDEVLDVMKEIAELGVSIFNIGQYLQPSLSHIKVSRYVHPDTFAMFKEEGLKMGFKVVESAPLVRSSYHADEQVINYMMLKGNT
ncbi:MAG: lipoyl synthase [Candidatus Marinimicrobia bacterium]|nr:lipoyl synthase [Candidatus Neomarinimicrobiota bacterium]MBT3634393.1 lipoyl synthase [Candidatus Neomarinimicrobiota bacterium]MBT3681698.1 lipoyl synthase [Candidatus Neomarinimicrobiota bacterium]MBT3759424.1 lipoyl synthase [Candidatus Neomarinimicrobiota bacterium]MBT3895912.1 lipoyl synthase [Candidatus Neomarinimicrobiota bacterium]